MNSPTEINAPEVEGNNIVKNTSRNKSKVKIEVNSKTVSIQRGNYRVSDLKETLGIEPDKELDQFINYEFVPLKDDAKIVIKGGEIFISHVRAGGSS